MITLCIVGTVQGVQALRDEIRQLQFSNEQMRAEHASLIKQNQIRQADLESENNELTISLTEKQKEINRLRNMNASEVNNSENFINQEYISMQQEILRLSKELEIEKEKNSEYDRKLKQTDYEIKASQLSIEDERKRNSVTIQELTNQIHLLLSR